MATFKTIEEAKEYFKGDKFATQAGMELEELQEDYALCSMTLNDNHKNANGQIMGGVVFTLADLAFAALSNNIHMPTVAQQVSINYLSSPKGERLIARSQLKKNGSRTIVVNTFVTDEKGRDVAQIASSGFKL